MSMNTPTIMEVLKAAIEESGLTRNQIAKETGIHETCLMRFMARGTSVRLNRADQFAAYLGLRLMPEPDAAPLGPAPENLARPTLAQRKAN